MSILFSLLFLTTFITFLVYVIKFIIAKINKTDTNHARKLILFSFLISFILLVLIGITAPSSSRNTSVKESSSAQSNSLS